MKETSEDIDISLEGGSSCLTVVRSALPGCVAPTLAAGGALAGGDIPFNISEGDSS